MCESSKARRPDTEWVPGALLPGLSGRTTESAALHPYPIGGTVSLYGLFHPARPSPCELFRAANWQMRRRVPSAGVPTAVLPRGAIVVEGRHKSRPLPLNKSLPRAAYRTAVRSFLLYHILNKQQLSHRLCYLLFNLFMV